MMDRRYIGVIFFSSLFIFLIFCCELILAWWYLHVSDFLLSLLRVCIRSSISVIAFIHALHSFMRRIHLCALFIYALYSLLGYIAFIHPFPYINYVCATLIHASHLPTHFIHSCATFTYALHIFFSFHVSATLPHIP